MSQQFYVIRKSDGDIEHKSHKYIKKVKNPDTGKYTYFYTKSQLDAYNRAKYYDRPYLTSDVKYKDKLVKAEVTKDKSGRDVTKRYTLYTDDLLSTRQSSSLSSGGRTTTKEVIRIGKIGQAWIKNRVKVRQTLRSAKDAINKGKKWLKKLFG